MSNLKSMLPKLLSVILNQQTSMKSRLSECHQMLLVMFYKEFSGLWEKKILLGMQ